MDQTSDLDPQERELVENVLKPFARALRKAGMEDREDIAKQLEKKYRAHPALAWAATCEVEARGIEILELRDPVTVSGRKTAWYDGPQSETGAWADLKKLLVSTGNWDNEDIISLDQSSTHIVANLPAPGLSPFISKGLVIGYVQSGKTASYTSVISKAADEGYKLFIVVAGLTDRLRKQTQMRLTKELVAQSPGRWQTITGPDYDFSAQHQTMQAPAMLAMNNGQYVLAVVKKNTARLARLTKWLETAKAQLREAPVLIIDDEADEASINTAKQERHRSAINKHLNELIRTFPKVAYVAYTATPFANLLIPADNSALGYLEDLYPTDFITDLPRSDAYVGAERIFGRSTLPSDPASIEQVGGMDVVRTIPIDEEIALRVPSSSARYTFVPPAVESLVLAVKWFVLSCAMRRARGQAAKHMTMLIHTSQYTAAHESMRNTAQGILDRERADLRKDAVAYATSMRKVWDAEQDCVAPDSGIACSKWEDVEREIAPTLEALRIYVENGVAQELDFEAGTVHGIVIGGNVLSRGLTIEGLAVSYFIRTASTYDTLLQMGRWFGFRRGYLDVCRIWMPLSLQRDFADLALVEEEIRTDIARYRDENLKPTDFAVRIRCHSTLLVTSKLKMRRAVSVSVGYGGREVSTRVFYREDENWLKEGWQAGASLLKRIDDSGKISTLVSQSILYKDVQAEKILDFLQDYRVHPDCTEFRRDVLADYIRKANMAGSLLAWNVVVVQYDRPSAGAPMSALGPLSVGLLSRSRVKETGADANYANIRALTSEGDAGIDLPKDALLGVSDRAGILKVRTDLLPKTGLLLLYPINKDSKAPRNSEKTRTSLDAEHHVLAAAIVFPGKMPTEGFLENDYIAADLSGVLALEPEEESFVETEDGIRVQAP